MFHAISASNGFDVCELVYRGNVTLEPALSRDMLQWADMYVPKVFAVDDLVRLQDFIEEFNFATVVTQRDGELSASHIPFLLDRGVGP